MNWKAISFALLGIGGIIAGLIDSAADQQLSTDASKKTVENYDEETVNKLYEAKRVIDAVDEVNKRERKEIADAVKKWKLENDYDGRLGEIHSNAVNELNEFKQSVNYFDRKEEIEENAENALDIFKDSIDYDLEIDRLEDEIETAKSAYKKRSKLYDIAGNGDDDVSDAVGELKKAEKEKMESSVKKAQDAINELKAKVSSEKSKIDRKKQSELRQLESEIQSVKTRIGKVENEASDAVRKEFSKAEEEIRKNIFGKRTDEEIHDMDIYTDSVEILETQKKIDSQNALDLYTSTPKYEKWANWFKANNWPKWLVIATGLLPYIPAGYLLISYTKFLVQTVKAM